MLSVQHAGGTRLVPGRAPLMCACAVGVYAIEAEVAVFAELVLDAKLLLLTKRITLNSPGLYPPPA